MSGTYKLEGKKPVPCSLNEWASGLHRNRKVAETYIPSLWFPLVGSFLWVDTVFLGIDHVSGDGPPLLFDTMVFRNGIEEVDDRLCASTWEEAEENHKKMVDKWSPWWWKLYNWL